MRDAAFLQRTPEQEFSALRFMPEFCLSTKSRPGTMTKLSIKTNIFASAAICCALSALFPTESFADLRNIACRAIRSGCYTNCSKYGRQDCYDQCDEDFAHCVFDNLQKQQSSPPPCRGIHCTFRNPHPPTTVGPPTRKPSPGQPVKPVGVSNPNKTTNAPVILDRQNDSGGGHGRGH